MNTIKSTINFPIYPVVHVNSWTTTLNTFSRRAEEVNIHVPVHTPQLLEDNLYFGDDQLDAKVSKNTVQ